MTYGFIKKGANYMVRIEVQNKRYNCDLTLKHKVSVFIGDSGVGKSWFVKALMDESNGYKVNYSIPVHAVELNGRDWDVQLNGKYNTTPLFIADDCDFVFTKEFGKNFNRIEKCYLIIIARTERRLSKLNKMNNISIDADSIYNFVSYGKEHSIEQSILLPSIGVNNINACNAILCEDSGSGYTFFKHLYKDGNVLSSEGKDSIVEYVTSHIDTFNGVDGLLLLVDYAAIGLRLKSIITILDTYDIPAYILQEYKSFEYMLLRSNMFKVDREAIYACELEYSSLETACEEMLLNLTKGKAYAYDKSKELKYCYYKPCCMMNREKALCDRGLSGDKFAALLKDTEFECLLKLKVV